jgi:hypothetical protein
LAEQYKSAHQFRMEEARRKHNREVHALTAELEASRSLCEQQAAELMVANGIAAAASAQAQEHLNTVRAIQLELKSAKMGLLLQQEQLKQQEADFQVQQSAWLEERSAIAKQHEGCEQELNVLRKKLSHGTKTDSQALSVRSIVATSRALHPGSRAFFAWAAHVRKQHRMTHHRAARKQNLRVQCSSAFASSRQKRALQLVFSQWREFKSHHVALMHIEVATTCLLLHRRLKNFFGLWFQTAFLSAPAQHHRRLHASSRNLLRCRVARALINNAILCREQNSQLLSLLSHAIHAFSKVSRSTALLIACASFKAAVVDTAAPSNLGPETNDIFSLCFACMKSIIEEKAKFRLHVR